MLERVAMNEHMNQVGFLWAVPSGNTYSIPFANVLLFHSIPDVASPHNDGHAMFHNILIDPLWTMNATFKKGKEEKRIRIVC